MNTDAQARQIETEVKQIFLNAGWTEAPYMTVKACMTNRGSWSARVRSEPTGMFNIDIWSQSERTFTRGRGRDHIFRTTKTGVVPVDKIAQFAKDRLVFVRAQCEAKLKRDAAKEDNTEIAKSLLARSRASTSKYFSDYHSTSGAFISADSNVPGKVRISVGELLLTEEQARALIDLVAGAYPKQ